MRNPKIGVRWISSLFVSAVALALLGACSNSASEAQISGDCSQQVRVGERVYTSYSSTTRDPDREFAKAELADCDDGTADSQGPVFRDDAERVDTWAFADIDPDEALGIRGPEETWQVLIAGSVSNERRDELIETLGRSAE